MKTYSTSEELAVVLFKNGFAETTHKYYPEKKGAKRSFRLRGRKLGFIFDYINIGVTLGNTYVFHRLSISETQLRAVLAYHQLTSADRNLWIQNHGNFNPLKICEVVNRMEEVDHWYRRPFYMRLKDAYERITI